MTTPRTHPKPGDTYTTPKGVTKALSVPDATGRVQILDPCGARYWAAGWGVWSEGTYARRDPKYDPQVGDTKTYVYPDGRQSPYVVTHSVEDGFRYVEVADADGDGFGRDLWEDGHAPGGGRAVYACGDDS